MAELRQIFLDTETTGLEIREGNRIIEIGCVEMVDRKLTGNNYHQYLKVGRDSEEGALAVHGITTEFLADKPAFSEIMSDFLNYVQGAELIIHNAPFDIGFLNHELALAKFNEKLETKCEVSDSLVLARQMHPGQRNTLDALCKRYDIKNEHRTLHGALLDSEILADVYLAMTGGQKGLSFGEESSANDVTSYDFQRLDDNRQAFSIIRASAEELDDHQKYLEGIDGGETGKSFWH